MVQKKTPGIVKGETARLMNRIKREIVIPQLKNGRRIGDIYYVDTSFVESDEQHERRLSILGMFSKGLFHLIKNYKKSEYYRHQTHEKKDSRKNVLKHLVKYYLLFRSIKKYGFKTDNREIRSFPCIFASEDIISRFDGHHRVSIARFLGYREIPVLLITPRDILRLRNLPDDIVSFISKFQEPDIEALRFCG